ATILPSGSWLNGNPFVKSGPGVSASAMVSSGFVMGDTGDHTILGPRTSRPDHDSSWSIARATASSLRCALVNLGYARSRLLSASTTAAATTSRVNHLWSAGTTYHGACGVAVCWIMSSYACMYSSQRPRSCASTAENFQFLSA